MSILIKGMKMPESCLLCFAQFGGWCYVAPSEIDERVAPTVEEAAEQGKPEWCPLIEIPNHGDLIDKDVLLKRLRNYACKPCKEYSLDKNGDRCKWCSFDDAFARIEKAKKVIPAERSEDGKT